MDKKILKQYVDACAMVHEATEELQRIKNQQLQVQRDTVQNSLDEFPYTRTTLKIEGASERDLNTKSMRERLQEVHLRKMIEAAKDIKTKVEEEMLHIPTRIQRIVIYKYFNNMTWDEVAVKLGREATGDSVRKEFNKFIK